MKKTFVFSIGNYRKPAAITTGLLLVMLGLFITVPAQYGAAKMQSVNKSQDVEPLKQHKSDPSQATLPPAASKSHVIRIYERQLAKTQIDEPTTNSVLRVINNAHADSDVDFIAVDLDGNEVARETVVVPPHQTAKFSLQEMFPNLSLHNLSTIEIQAAGRPAEPDEMVTPRQGQDGTRQVVTEGLLAVAFFSQRDARWANTRLGTCAGTTIGRAGCAITAIAMAGARSVYNWNPATVNDYLTKNAGYASGCLVKWASPANVDGPYGFTYINAGVVNSAANLKSLIDKGQFAVAKSARFSSHYVLIIGYNGTGAKLSDFVYLDPWDTSAVYRYVGDGWVTATSATQIYR